jgi:hypothetical protein
MHVETEVASRVKLAIRQLAYPRIPGEFPVAWNGWGQPAAACTPSPGPNDKRQFMPPELVCILPPVSSSFNATSTTTSTSTTSSPAAPSTTTQATASSTSTSPSQPCPTLLATGTNNNAVTVDCPGGSIIVNLAPGVSPNLQYLAKNTCSVTATVTWTIVTNNNPEGITDPVSVGPGETQFTSIFSPGSCTWVAAFATVS